ncbi:uncharacterized protein LOC132272716 [Cornus florida]|uniref:uncharacterized protein LOC132272716 n=1 Tax=Cornus florida TaxID=4283 RepID=UPI00289DF196|nr:uncharacterized protein LOC132272716 [Cornus florida]
MVISNFTIRRILIDNGNSADILFIGVYDKLKIGQEKLRPMKSPLVGFSGDKVYPLGAVTLPVTAGANPKLVTVMVDFVVVNCLSLYNIILGRKTLNAMKAITFTYHLLMRFPIEYGMGKLRGDQTMDRECYDASLRKTKVQEALTIKGLEGRDMPDFHRAEPTEELEEVILGDGEPEKKVSIGSLFPLGIKDELTQFLRKNRDVFAWVHEDMSGIDLTIMEHRLNVNFNFKPVRQKRRTFVLERNQETFEVLKRHKMKLNPNKCAFGVSSGKFLGYMVSRRGIEANPEKIRAVIDMRSPISTKDLQRLTGKIAALSRLISRSTDRCLLFFHVLRKAFKWTLECEQAFKELKQCLNSPSLLSRTIPGEELYIYLAISTTAVRSALIREEEEVLHKLESSGRLMKWSVELGEFDIQYKIRTAAKAQVLTDFLVEFTPPEEEKQPQFLTEPGSSEQIGPEVVWNLFVDGSSNVQASGAGFVLAPQREKDEKMKSYLQKVEELKNHFQRFSIHQIPREENGKADALARLATALEPEINKTILLEYLDEPSISQERQIEVQQAILSVEWADPIIRYIKDGVLPTDRAEARKVKMRAARFMFIKGVIYKRSFSMLYLRCWLHFEGDPPRSLWKPCWG